jgi:hypothetical protein
VQPHRIQVKGQHAGQLHLPCCVLCGSVTAGAVPVPGQPHRIQVKGQHVWQLHSAIESIALFETAQGCTYTWAAASHSGEKSACWVVCILHVVCCALFETTGVVPVPGQPHRSQVSVLCTTRLHVGQVLLHVPHRIRVSGGHVGQLHLRVVIWISYCLGGEDSEEHYKYIEAALGKLYVCFYRLMVRMLYCLCSE